MNLLHQLPTAVGANPSQSLFHLTGLDQPDGILKLVEPSQAVLFDLQDKSPPLRAIARQQLEAIQLRAQGLPILLVRFQIRVFPRQQIPTLSGLRILEMGENVLDTENQSMGLPDLSIFLGQ
jgi:hypothetical protein